MLIPLSQSHFEALLAMQILTMQCPMKPLLSIARGVARLINAEVRRNLSDQIDAIGGRCHTLQHILKDCQICRCILSGETLACCEFLIERQQRCYITMAKQLDISVLAEWVETIEQQAFLQGQGCNFVQGYLYCKPIPEDKLFDRWQKKELTFK